jgi:HAD superfamily hydrolase (TIGR01509 family)
MSEFPPFQAVIFDMDGVLLDTESVMNRIEPEAAKLFNVEMTKEILHQLTGKPEKDVDVILKTAYGPEFPIADYRREFWRLVEEVIEKEGLQLKPGVLEMLDWCDQTQLPMAVATSTLHKKAETQLLDVGIRARFRAIVGGDQVERSKPAPDIFLTTARELDIAPAACLALEDSYNGVRAARAAGMITVMVPDQLPATPEMRELAHLIVPSLHELHALLTKEN